MGIDIEDLKLWGAVLGVIAIAFILTWLVYTPKPKVDVVEYNDTPANYRDGFGVKMVLSNELPPEKYHRVYRYVITSDDGTAFDSKSYLELFEGEGDAIIKRVREPGSEMLILFSDFKPDPHSADGREARRVRWLMMKER